MAFVCWCAVKHHTNEQTNKPGRIAQVGPSRVDVLRKNTQLIDRYVYQQYLEYVYGSLYICFL